MTIERGWVILLGGRALLGAPGYHPPMRTSAFLFCREQDAIAAMDMIDPRVRSRCTVAEASMVVHADLPPLGAIRADAERAIRSCFPDRWEAMIAAIFPPAPSGSDWQRIGSEPWTLERINAFRQWTLGLPPLEQHPLGPNVDEIEGAP